jgi:delta 1-pyrroline-5-carboxylate dehydrogenase
MAAVNTPVSAPHLFICFSSKDEAIARDVVRYLEGKGLTCWISVRDVPAGQNYQETIVQAVESARGVVFLFSENSGKSGETKKELSLAGAENIPVFPLRLAPIVPTGALRYELATRQWIDLFEDPMEALAKLAETINRTLSHVTLSRALTQAAVPAEEDHLPALAALPSPVQTQAKQKRAPIVAADSAEFEAVRALLARHIGPIAKVFVQKASSEAANLDAFCERLADHVTSPADRAVFLKAVKARLSVGR